VKACVPRFHTKKEYAELMAQFEGAMPRNLRNDIDPSKFRAALGTTTPLVVESLVRSLFRTMLLEVKPPTIEDHLLGKRTWTTGKPWTSSEVVLLELLREELDDPHAKSPESFVETVMMLFAQLPPGADEQETAENADKMIKLVASRVFA
jgi:hypothetical protein